jgi:hypothetical protein
MNRMKKWPGGRKRQYAILRDDLQQNDKNEGRINLSMAPGISELQTRLYRTAVLILLVGLISSVVIYLTAEDVPEDVLLYETDGGSSYGVSGEDSKKYMRDMEQFGGRANVLAYKFRLWFWGIWRGRSLAFTISVISVILFYSLRFVADRTQSAAESESGNGEKNTDIDKNR